VISVPQAVRNKLVALGAEQWLDDLPALVERIETEWSITVGQPFPGGTESFVAEVTLDDGTPAVLKLLIPTESASFNSEVAALRLVKGAGCALLLRDDAARGALLLERLGRPLQQLGLPLSRRHEILASIAAKVWRPAAGFGFPTGAQKAERLAQFITRAWEDTDRPCSLRSVEHALSCAARRKDAHDDERAVLVHGDVHQWNALEAASGFKLVDPDGLLAEPEYDLGVIMREDPEDLLASNDPYERARWLAARTGLDPAAIWEWGVVERMSTGLLCTQIGLQPAGRQMLRVAERVVDW
jgi:streptomycin 6-kinase